MDRKMVYEDVVNKKFRYLWIVESFDKVLARWEQDATFVYISRLEARKEARWQRKNGEHVRVRSYERTIGYR